MRSEELVILDENLLHSPFGSTDPYKFYRLLNVEITASLPQIEAAHNNFRFCIIPTVTTLSKTPGQLNLFSKTPGQLSCATYCRNGSQENQNPTPGLFGDF